MPPSVLSPSHHHHCCCWWDWWHPHVQGVSCRNLVGPALERRLSPIVDGHSSGPQTHALDTMHYSQHSAVLETGTPSGSQSSQIYFFGPTWEFDTVTLCLVTAAVHGPKSFSQQRQALHGMPHATSAELHCGQALVAT